MAELITGILTSIVLGGLITLAIVSGRIHLRAYLARVAEHKRIFAEHAAYERELDPRYQAKLEADRRFWLATQELDLKRAITLTRVETSQYGTYLIDMPSERLLHLQPVYKPALLKPGDVSAQEELTLPGSCTFSQVLATFQPSETSLFLSYLPGEQSALASAEGLCHVALAGATGGGKSTLVRLLMAQLCFVGASVLLLNPHYTHYDVRSREDWTPFEPYLYDDPMKCRRYDVIGGYLRQVAEEMLPARLERYSRSLPIGKPFYLILDELPAIVKHVPEAPGYMADLLREGRKVGLFLVTAAQDFLVKTIMKDEGGAVRDCFRTAIYVGGDATTARVLLDVRGNIDDGGLGKGVVMLRSAQVKQAQLARVPYVDNEALYQLLGPSTYKPVVDVYQTPETPVYEQRERDFPERHDATIIDADMPETDQEETPPANVMTLRRAPVVEPEKPEEPASGERQQKYNLTDTEISAFLAAYRACRNRDKALTAIGKGSSNYRECANRILAAYGLREEAE